MARLHGLPTVAMMMVGNLLRGVWRLARMIRMIRDVYAQHRLLIEADAVLRHPGSGASGEGERQETEVRT